MRVAVRESFYYAVTIVHKIHAETFASRREF